jgi:hypothetical protein
MDQTYNTQPLSTKIFFGMEKILISGIEMINKIQSGNVRKNVNKNKIKSYFLRPEKKSHFSLKIDDAKSVQLNKIIFLIKLKLFNSDNTKFNSFKIIQ